MLEEKVTSEIKVKKEKTDPKVAMLMTFFAVASLILMASKGSTESPTDKVEEIAQSFSKRFVLVDGE